MDDRIVDETSTGFSSSTSYMMDDTLLYDHYKVKVNCIRLIFSLVILESLNTQ